MGIDNFYFLVEIVGSDWASSNVGRDDEEIFANYYIIYKSLLVQFIFI